MKLTHCLRNPKSKKPTPVHTFIHWSLDGRHYQWKLSTGLKVEPDLWDHRRKRARKGATQEKLLNTKLSEIEATLQRLFAEMETLGIDPTPATVRERFNALKAPRRKRVEFFEAYNEFVRSLDGRLQETTLKVHRTAIRHLKDFRKAYGLVVDFDRFDVLFFDKLIHYLTQVAGLNNVTAWKVISTIRVFLKFAVEQGYTTNKEYERFTKKRMPRGEKSEKVYVTLPELERLKKLDLSGDSRLDITRDLFLFQAHTGLRYSDVERVGIEHIHDDEIRLVTAKNKKAIRVPLLPVAKRILEKYEYRLPARSNQKQNEYLKDLCKKAEIDRPVPVVDYRGIQRIEKVVPKHELIGTHSAKRTFVSILRQHDVTVEAICRITGNTRQSIERYILKDEEDMAAEIEKIRQALG